MLTMALNNLPFIDSIENVKRSDRERSLKCLLSISYWFFYRLEIIREIIREIF